MEWFFDPNARWVITGCLLLGMSSGVLGCFAFLRKQSLIGDTIAHAALPGICIAYMLYQEKNTLLFMLGAAIAGLLGTLSVNAIVKYSRVKADAALGIVLSVFFGFGTVLLTKIAQTGKANQSGLDAFLFGKAASLVGEDISVMAYTAGGLLLVSFLLFKELKLLCFDPNFGRGSGFPMGMLDGLFMAMIVLTVIIGLQAVGVVLMAAMLIIPPLAARYWTEKLSTMVLLSGGIGALSGVLGTVISGFVPKLPTGPVIVLAAALLFILSLLMAPGRGLVFKWFASMRLRRRIAVENVLNSLYNLAETKSQKEKDGSYWFSLAQIRGVCPQQEAVIKKVLRQLQNQGWVYVQKSGSQAIWRLTAQGVQEAYEVTLHERLNEITLMYEARFGSNQADERIGYLQHQLSQETLQELMDLLKQHERIPLLLPGNTQSQLKRAVSAYPEAFSKGGKV